MLDPEGGLSPEERAALEQQLAQMGYARGPSRPDWGVFSLGALANVFFLIFTIITGSSF